MPGPDFSTDDMALAAFLMAKGGQFKAIRDIGGRFYEFVVDGPAEAESLRSDFVNGRASIEPQAYHHALRRLRAEVARGRAGLDEHWRDR